MHIALCGLIGAGKTTLSKDLAGVMGLSVGYESVSGNEVLKMFYNDMPKHAFHLQMRLLIDRAEQCKGLKTGTVSDRSIFEDRLFVNLLSDFISESERQTYIRLSRFVIDTLDAPTLLLYLDVSPDVCLQRIKERGREMETGITLEYLTQLHAEYETFISDLEAGEWHKYSNKELKVLRLSWEEFLSADVVAEKIASVLDCRN